MWARRVEGDGVQVIVVLEEWPVIDEGVDTGAPGGER